MKVTELSLPGVLLVEPKVHGDARGFFVELFHEGRYREHGIVDPFLQDNLSLSRRGVLRGLHFQNPTPQGKLVSVLSGEVFDVAVDVRVGSPTFGKWTAAILSETNKHQLWVPGGFAHGFVVLSEQALFAYKCTNLYRPEAEHVVLWSDPAIGIEWPLKEPPSLSARDEKALPLHEIAHDKLPVYVEPRP
jgi:dTDP-4-dehydrorhamnose 3,5-epimerase